MTPRLLLFDDDTARSWVPLSLTRPAGELLFGAYLLRERAEMVWGAPCSGYLGCAELRGFEESDSPPVLEGSLPPNPDHSTLVVLSRALIAGGPLDDLPNPEARAGAGDGAAVTLAVGNRVVGWFLPPGAEGPTPEALARPDEAPRKGRTITLPGRLLDRPWDLVSENGARLTRDLRAWAGGAAGSKMAVADTAAGAGRGVERLGDHPLLLGDGVELDPGVVLDLRKGPVALAHGVRIGSFTLLEGPAYIGPDSRLLGGLVSGVSTGPGCRLRGELADSVVLGYTNKAHDGHIGHAYLGRWVNLGAMTTNSDLKNNYGNVRVWTPRGEEDSGLMKVGCFLGDHVKTAIGTLIGTGAVVGAGSNLFGDEVVGRYTPPFSWGGGPGSGTHDLERFLATARTAMGRRHVELSSGMESVLRRAWELGIERGGGAR